MIVIDTNVVSELLKVDCNPLVRACSEQIDRSVCFITAPTTYEITFGISRLPPGKRRDRLSNAWLTMRDKYLNNRVLPLDDAASRFAGELRTRLVAAGDNRDICDIFIGSIAVCAGAAIVTRNTRHFSDLPLTLIDPWLPHGASR
jgi:toxin FitB